jgi:hypothetical protein
MNNLKNVKRNLPLFFVLSFCWFLVLATRSSSAFSGQIGGGSRGIDLAAMHEQNTQYYLPIQPHPPSFKTTDSTLLYKSS